jgi:hypothetical protein
MYKSDSHAVCAALAHLISNKEEEEEEVWLMIMENVPQNEKLALFLA